MSLFKSREWWSVNLNEKEMFDLHCLLVGHVGGQKYQSIILGNHEGLFRIYNPSGEMSDDGVYTGYKPADLLLEAQLPHPILMFEMGAFVSGSMERFLAVLHPRVLSVYSVCGKEGAGETDVKVTLNVVYQHQLRHSAHSLVKGAFGGVQRRDFICILALDGLLSFYEQESLAFHVYLPDFLLPTPFAYLPTTDAFLFLNASQELNCYSYEALAGMSQAGEGGASKKVVTMWSHNIGEFVIDMTSLFTDCLNILVLTERNFYNLDDTGRIVFIKRLEYKPISFHGYVTAETKKLMTMICTEASYLNVYENTSLKWSTKIDQIPVCVRTLTVKEVRGGTVLLSEDGLLQCVYLGTHPSPYLIPPLNEPDLIGHNTEQELRELQADVLEGDVLSALSEDVLVATLRVEQNVEQSGFTKTCRVEVLLETTTPLNKVQVALVVDPPLVAVPASQTITSCCDRSTASAVIHAGEGGVASSLEIKAVVTFVSSAGVPRVIQRRGDIPALLVLESCPPVKEAKYKLTVNTNKPVAPINQIFPEFAAEDSSVNVVGLKFINSDMAVTILAAKTSQRYRLQSDHMEAVTLVLRLLLHGINKHFHKVPDFRLTYTSALPLQTYFEHIENYFNMMQKRSVLVKNLGQTTCQYRAIQKKVLTNLRDVTPKPVSSLHKILRDTHDMIVTGIQDVQKSDSALDKERRCLSSLSRLQVTLLGLMTITSKDLAQLEIVFNPHIHDTEDQGWLEVQGAAAALFLRTSLAKSSKDQYKAIDISLDQVSDVSKVIKKFSSVVDRVTKGTHLLERNEFENDKEILPTLPNLKESCEVTSDVLPQGSRLADLETPVPPSRVPPLVRPPRPALTRPRPEPTITEELTMEQEPSNEVQLQENMPSTEICEVQTVATIESGSKHQLEDNEEQVDGPGGLLAREETLPEVKENDTMPTKYIANVEDDEIWDLRLDEMRI